MMMLADRVRARTNRAAAVSQEEFADLLANVRGNVTRTRAGVSVGDRTALGLTAWYRGTYALATGVGFLPVHAYRKVNGKNEIRANPLWFRPDADQTLPRVFEFMCMSLFHRGNAYTYKLRNPSGMVTGLREIHPDRVTGGIAPDGSKRFLIDHDGIEYTTREIFHVPWICYDSGRFGMAPLQRLAEALGGVAAADQYAQRFYGQGAHMGGYISLPQELNETQALRYKAEWERFHQGLRDAHQTGVLSKGATYTPLALNAAEAQLIEARTFGITEIARALNIPPHKLYELSRATFSNIEQQSIEYVQDGLQPIVERFEDAFNNDLDLLPGGNLIEFTLDGRLRGDMASQFDAFAKSIGRPWMTPNEGRALKNMDPIDGGDELLMPLNMGQAATHGTDALGGDPTE